MNMLSPDEVKGWFDLYYTRLCTFAFRLVNCQETARDLAQDAFVVLMEGTLKSVDDPSAIKSYLYSTVKHAALNRIRHKQIASRIHEQDFVEDAKVLQAMMHAEVMGELHAALESLPSGCSQICKMGYLEGMKNFEIAEALNVSINTVKTQKQRALMLLRNRLSPQALSLLIYFLLK
ncbi:sigma-70 family RNA polymerase sigma factor [Olivibacter domesticus]|uniref:RNA polymerase sigma-70 factor, ECF subfamily n=1 Tax=Olivibacter domesticus TaxID=407022 RepID=A0A1H7T9Q6_OLID1|nr:sigma-70 family RNA polymerase sigma factor [Olivibacter domesticus]SEL81621.1 RNA polymerase sigma-70 factor, ECF subfamily [Olivibacter domesticus]